MLLQQLETHSCSQEVTVVTPRNCRYSWTRLRCLKCRRWLSGVQLACMSKLPSDLLKRAPRCAIISRCKAWIAAAPLIRPGVPAAYSRVVPDRELEAFYHGVARR